MCPGGPATKPRSAGLFEELHTAVGFAALKKFRRGAAAREYCRRGFRLILPPYMAFERFGGSMEQENRLKITVWLKPDIVQRMDGWLRADNCKSRGEFTEKALRFYMGYLATDDTSVFLSHILVDTLQGIVADSHNRLRSMIFKWCVELNMMGHTIAAHFRADPINRRELRAYAVDEVKRTNGQISFDRALDQQRRFPEDVFDDDV